MNRIGEPNIAYWRRQHRISGRAVSDFARLAVDLSLISDDLLFYSNGGTLKYVVDFNVIQLCQFPGDNIHLATWFSDDTRDFKTANVLAISRTLWNGPSKGTARIDPCLYILAPHRRELDRSYRRAMEGIDSDVAGAELATQDVNLATLLANFQGIDENDINEATIGKIVVMLRENAPKLLSLFRHENVHAAAINRHFGKILKMLPVSDPNLLRKRGRDLELWHSIVMALDSRRYPYNVQKDCEALLLIDALNRNAERDGSQERFVLLTTDTAILGISNIMNALDIQDHWSCCHARDPRFLTFMPGFSNTVLPPDQVQQFVLEMSERIARILGIEPSNLAHKDALTVCTAYPHLLWRQLPKLMQGRQFNKVGLDVIEKGDGLAIELGNTMAITRATRFSTDMLQQARQQVGAAANLVISRSFPSELDWQGDSEAVRKILRILRDRNLYFAVAEEISLSLRRAVGIVDVAQKLGAEELMDSIQMLIAHRDSNDYSLGRSPFTVRHHEVRGFFALFSAKKNRIEMKTLLKIVEMAPFYIEFTTAFIFGLTEKWALAEEHCLRAIKCADSMGKDSPEPIGEALLFLSYIKRIWDPTPERFQESAWLLRKARRMSDERLHRTLERDLRFDLEEVEQALIYRNYRFFLRESSSWKNIGSEYDVLFLDLAAIWDHLSEIKEIVEGRDWHDSDEIIDHRLRSYLYINICSYCLFRWLWIDSASGFEDEGAFYDALEKLGKIVLEDFDNAPYIDRVVYLISNWYRHKSSETNKDCGGRAVKEINLMLTKKILHLQQYQLVKFARYKEIIENHIGDWKGLSLSDILGKGIGT